MYDFLTKFKRKLSEIIARKSLRAYLFMTASPLFAGRYLTSGHVNNSGYFRVHVGFHTPLNQRFSNDIPQDIRFLNYPAFTRVNSR